MADRIAFRINELAKAAGVGRTLLYEEFKAGRLKAHKIGSRTVILVEDANAWIRSRPVATPRSEEPTNHRATRSLPSGPPDEVSPLGTKGLSVAEDRDQTVRDSSGDVKVGQAKPGEPPCPLVSPDLDFEALARSRGGR
jgi:hypothetical protein